MTEIAKNKLKRVLTIAGSDSSGGAGIQADLKTYSAFGVYGMSAVTAITAQNTVGVQDIFEIPASIVGMQIDSVLNDIGVDAVKIGMLGNEKVINTVASRLRKFKIKLIVLDPVMVAKSGDLLLMQDSQNSLVKQLFPISYAVTPNLHEAKAITGLDIRTVEDMKKAAKILCGYGARNIIIKGGHLESSSLAIDILYDGKEFFEFSSKRINTPNTHGTGCTFASAITAELAKGNDIYQAVKIAKQYITKAIKSAAGLSLGHGHGPLNHMVKIN